MPRTVIRPRDRFEILQRDGFTCRYCGRQPGETELQIDHVKPVSQGGTNSLLNLITSCRLCNAGKGKNTVDHVPIHENVIKNVMLLADREAELVRAINHLIKLREQRFQAAVNMICSAFSLKHTDTHTAKHVMWMIEEYGPHVVAEWLDAAFRRNVRESDHLIKYLYGCARNTLKTEVNDANS